MTDPATLLALADRCEQAAWPDKMLDYEIAWAAGYRFEKAKFEKRKWWRDSKGVRCSGLAADAEPPRFTASLDAAVMLVPEGCEWLRKSGQCMTVYRVPDDLKEWARHIDARCATPALALCAAALRARAAAHD
jgi:hypothetical protein